MNPRLFLRERVAAQRELLKAVQRGDPSILQAQLAAQERAEAQAAQARAQAAPPPASPTPAAAGTPDRSLLRRIGDEVLAAQARNLQRAPARKLRVGRGFGR